MTYPWGHNRRFNAYSNYLKKKFGARVQKVTIDAGFTCPNRDGVKGTGGCTFCSNDAFNPSYCSAVKPVRQQIEEGMRFHRKRYRSAQQYLAYFQAYSNTYGSLEYLKSIYQEAIDMDGICGLVIGTRPDCIDDKKLDFFKQLSEQMYVIIEYGIESCNNNILRDINRGHTFEKTVEAIEKTAAAGIRTGGHMIFGLPGETREQMLDTAHTISKLPLNNIKFHQLQIIEGTRMGEDFKKNPKKYELFHLEEYLNFMVRYLEDLSPEIVVERIAGEAPPSKNIGVIWNIRYDVILNQFEQLQVSMDSYQGKNYSGKN